MAENSLLSALSENGDNGGHHHEANPATRVTRSGGRRSQGANTPTPEPFGAKTLSKRPIRDSPTAPASAKRLKVGSFVALYSYLTTNHLQQADTMSAAGIPPSLDLSQPIRPAADSEGFVTSSATDRNISDTLARMQHHLDNKESFRSISASTRRNIIKGLRSSFGNRYNGRCTEAEKKDYIARWVKLASLHNDLLTSAPEKDSLGIKINPKWLEQTREAIVLD